LNFQRSGEFLEKIPSMGEVWIFSGTAQSELIENTNCAIHE